MVSEKPRLLIVDDEPDMLDFLERVFRPDYDVTRAAGAEEAILALERGEFQVLLTDHKMPRMSGIELLERVGGTHPEMVKVLISGFTEVPEIHRAIKRCAIHNYVVKPVDSEKLRHAVAEAVQAKATGTVLGR